MDVERIAYTIGYASELFKLLSDPTRLLIFIYLAKKGEATVKEIADALGRPENLVSYHIGIVKRMNIIGFRKVGRNVYYKLVDDRFRRLVQLTLEFVESRREPTIRPRGLRFQLKGVLENLKL